MAELNIYKPESQVYQRGVAQDPSPGAIDVSGPKRAEGAVWDQVGKGVQAVANEFIRRHEQAVNLRADEILTEQKVHNNNVKFALDDLSSVDTASLSPARMLERYKSDELNVAGENISPYQIPDDLDPDVEKLVKNRVELQNQELYGAIHTKSKTELDKRGAVYLATTGKQMLEAMHHAVNGKFYDPEKGDWLTITNEDGEEIDYGEKFDRLRWNQFKAIDKQVEYGTISKGEGAKIKRKIEETMLSAQFTRDYLHDPDLAVERAIDGHYKYTRDTGGGILESNHWSNQVKWDRYGKSKAEKQKKNRHALAVLTHQAQASKESAHQYLAEWGIRDDANKKYDLNEDKLKEELNDPESMLFETDITEADLLPLLRSANKNVRWQGESMTDEEFFTFYKDYTNFVEDQIFETHDGQYPDPTSGKDTTIETTNEYGTHSTTYPNFPENISPEQFEKLNELVTLRDLGMQINSSLKTDLNMKDLNKKIKRLNRYTKFGEATGKTIAEKLQQKISNRIQLVNYDPAQATVEAKGLDPQDREGIAEEMKNNGHAVGRNLEGTVTKSQLEDFNKILGRDKKNEQAN